jgi:hypothetical protein
VVGAVDGLTATAYTAAYVTFVSPYGLFLVSAGMLVATLGTPILLTGAVGVALGPLRRRDGPDAADSRDRPTG